MGRRPGVLTIIGPGVLVAATGVGAGDLATAALAGTKLGVAVLWAVLLGAFFKFVLNEGLTRWQLATGETLLEGAMERLGRPAQYIFLIYLLVWTFSVAAALMSACGIASQSIYPVSEDPSTGKIIYGMSLSAAGILLVRLGGYRLFGKIMGLCIGLMFLTVVTTALLLRPAAGELAAGLFVPSFPDLSSEAVSWTIALMGGVGGTVTVLCYGYWIREEGRLSIQELGVCRLDLAAGYLMTAMFGVGMVVIGSTVEVEGRGALLVTKLAERLAIELGPGAKWAFLIGAWSAVFSSLLGVWQSVPYLFTDLWNLIRQPGPAHSAVDTRSKPYRSYLYAMAILPMSGLFVGFTQMQKIYAILGALFIPMLAIVLLLLNGRADWVGRYRNRPVTTAVLWLVLLFFVTAAWLGFGG